MANIQAIPAVRAVHFIGTRLYHQTMIAPSFYIIYFSHVIIGIAYGPVKIRKTDVTTITYGIMSSMYLVSKGVTLMSQRHRDHIHDSKRNERVLQNLKNHRDHIHDSKQDLHLQIGIFLWTLILALLLLCEFFFSLPLYGMVATAFILIISSLFFKVKYKDFYTYRDRGQRTQCAVIALYISLLFTGTCLYLYSRSTELTWDYGLVFLFGFLFFTNMAYQTLSRTMVVGNKRMPRRYEK